MALRDFRNSQGLTYVENQLVLVWLKFTKRVVGWGINPVWMKGCIDHYREEYEEGRDAS